MRTFAGFGHSHVVALAKGAYALQVEGATIGGDPVAGAFHYLYDESFVPEVGTGPGGPTLNPNIAKLLEGDGLRFVVLAVGGNEHNALSIAQSSRRFDFVLAAEPDLPLDPRADILPASHLRETIRDWMAVKIATMRAIRRAVTIPVLQVEPPPPLPREQVLAHPQEFFRNALGSRRLSSDTLRYKMWRLQTALYRELCAEMGVEYVTVPPAFIDANGMLARHAWATDATHANETFGKAMMHEVFGRLDASLVEVAS